MTFEPPPSTGAAEQTRVVRDDGLYRNRSGDFIHRAGCPHLGLNGVRWRWADENADEDWKATAPWLKPCMTCNPPSPWGNR